MRFITDRIRRMREGNVFSLSTPGGGGTQARSSQGGVPEPGPAGGTPMGVLWQGVPWQGLPHLRLPPSDPTGGTLIGEYPNQGVPQWGYPDQGYPNGRVPQWGYPDGGTLIGSTLTAGYPMGGTLMGVPPMGGTPPQVPPPPIRHGQGVPRWEGGYPTSVNR